MTFGTIEIFSFGVVLSSLRLRPVPPPLVPRPKSSLALNLRLRIRRGPRLIPTIEFVLADEYKPIRELLSLQGKTAIVTGSARGPVHFFDFA